MAIKQVLNYRGNKVSRPGGLERRQQIIQATWRIIIKEGMRGVRHRAVAKEANVPLAATTYYFKDLEELITSAFTNWAEQASIHSIRFREDCYAAVSDIDVVQLKDKKKREKLAEQISEITITHVLEQILINSDDRILELAFQHEALRNLKLKTVVLNQQNAFIKDLEAFHSKIESKDPQADARISLSLISRLEQDAIMQGLDSFDKRHIKRMVRRHIFSVFEISDPSLES